ncbi:hypothetical protein H0H81_001974 [Sphagnurus paluster]|uniref:Uncharacterized protein n=1 Tax=Sphagnurus paluster TaxID=117069 RepID=A0A9P7GW41_9AGAR|nr:hypothetical protein H0H81_001974 [Sphagnurus paluster]
MSFSTVLQRRAHAVSIFRRYASLKATKPKSKRTLPDEKLRALIALYHQAETFITPENLSQRIDEAFLFSNNDPYTKPSVPTVKDLESTLAQVRTAPKIAEWDQETLREREYHGATQRWSGVKTGRELQVVEALYGVNAAELGKTLPGLEVLREAVATNKVPKPLSPEDVREFLEKEPMEVPRN